MEGGGFRLRSFMVESKDADVTRDEPIWSRETVTGGITSGGFSHNSEVSVSIDYIPNEISDE